MEINFTWNDLVDLVDEASADDINKIAHAISDIITVVNSNDGENIDLSNYYTKEETDEKDQQIIDKVDYNSGDIQTIFSTIGQIGIDISKKEDVSNKTNTISDEPSMDKYPSELAVFEEFMIFDNSLKAYIAEYTTALFYNKEETDTQISDAIGDVETSLENIIAKYGLGGDAS